MMNDKKYSGRINPGDAAWRHSPWTRLLAERCGIASLFCVDKTVLDSCCGTGWGTLRHISPRARKVVAFDICELSDEGPSALPNTKLMTIDAREIDLPGERYEVVLTLDAIEHFSLPDASLYLSGLKSVSTPTTLL